MQQPNPQNVLMVHNFYQIGGGEHTVFENETRLLEEHGHKVIKYTRHNNELKQSKVKKLLLPFTVCFSIKTYKDVRRIIKEENIDIVHCQNTFPLISPSVYYAAISRKIPVVQTVHNFRFLCANALFYRDGHVCEDCLSKGISCGVKNGCYRNSKLQSAILVNMLKLHRLLGTYKKINYIFLTEFNRGKFRTLLGDYVDRQFVKPNFEYFDIDTGEAPNDYNKFVFAGRLSEYKGVRFLIDTWKDIDDKKLVIFGSGELEDEVKALADIKPNVIFKGFRPQNEIFDELKSSAAMLFTSESYETFGLTVIEAFAMDVPVLCSDVGNSAELVNSNNAGLLYRCGDREDFLKKLAEISNPDKNKELKINAREGYLKKYTPDINYGIIRDIYDEVCR